MTIEFYLKLFVVVTFFNALPAFAPPTWLVLAYAKLTNPGEETALILLTGLFGAITGRTILYYLTKFFSLKFMSKQRKEKLHLLKELSDKKPFDIFIVSFLYSLSPLSSNIMFILSGASEINIYPLILGFILGRAISYGIGIVVYVKSMSAIESYVKTDLSLLVDLITFFLAIALIFVDWEKVLRKAGLLKDHHIK